PPGPLRRLLKEGQLARWSTSKTRPLPRINFSTMLRVITVGSGRNDGRRRHEHARPFTIVGFR
ncbi:MAG: hypothetical protein KKE37_00030, partial [Verrucomicrobia bacterium]|nr:hypothetical protein [Verrucomicrobiota bacterium]